MAHRPTTAIALGATVLAGLLTACDATVPGSAIGADVVPVDRVLVGDAAKGGPARRAPDGITVVIGCGGRFDGGHHGATPVTVAVDKTGW